MSENTNNRLYLMITITNRVMGATHFLDFYRAFGAPVVFTALGRGTASNDILNTLGLEATEKSVMFSVVTPAVKDVLMRELVDTMRIDRPGSGHRRVPAPEQCGRPHGAELSDLRQKRRPAGYVCKGGRTDE